MARLLFDASALVEVLVRDGVPLEAVYDEHVLDLAFYEAGNALWNIGVREAQLSDGELQDAVESLSRLGREVVVDRVSDLDLAHTMTLARDEGLTFYDTAYLTVAQRDELVLVSEDSALRGTAEQYTSAATMSDLGD